MTDVREVDLSDVLESPVGRGELASPGPMGLRGPQPGPDARTGRLRLYRPGIRWRPILWFLILLSPTILSGIYYAFIASDRYVSTAAFIVRTASKPMGETGGLGAFLRMAGLGRAEDDTYSVKNFIESRDAVRQVQAALPLADMYGLPSVDPLSRYPSILFGSTNEELFRYYVRMTSASYNATTGITTLSVQAFRPDDALAIAKRVLEVAENLVNQLNTRIHEDAVASTEQEVKHEEERLTDAQVAVTNFQNKESMIDPTAPATVVTTIVAKLQADLAQTQARIADMKASSPNNPGLPALLRQAETTRAQIDREAARVTSSQEGLADKLGAYQRLVLEREFATKALALATSALDSARTEARRKQLYIERIVEPNLSDKATLPLRTWTTFTIFVVNILVVFIGWMLRAGVKEHISSTH